MDGTGKVGRGHTPDDSDPGFHPASSEEVLKDFTCEMAWADEL